MTAFVLLMEVVLCSEVISINFTTRNKTITSYVGMTMVKKNTDKVIISVNKTYFSHLPAYMLFYSCHSYIAVDFPEMFLLLVYFFFD